MSLKFCKCHNTVFQLVYVESGETHLDVAVTGKNDFGPVWKAKAPSECIATKHIMC